MKHPHCNRSLSAHLFWCRGFAPLFFIVSVALFVVAVGSGAYFMFQSVDTPADSGEVITVSDVPVGTTGAEVVAVSAQAPITATPTIAKTNPVPPMVAPVTSVAPVAAPAKPAPVKPFDCGVGMSAEVCVFEHIANCTAARGIITDEVAGVRVEHTVDGLINGKCTYRSTIASAPAEYAILEGLDVRCSLPKDQLLQVLQASTDDELLRLCTGSYVEIVRQARGMDPIAQ